MRGQRRVLGSPGARQGAHGHALVVPPPPHGWVAGCESSRPSTRPCATLGGSRSSPRAAPSRSRMTPRTRTEDRTAGLQAAPGAPAPGRASAFPRARVRHQPDHCAACAGTARCDRCAGIDAAHPRGARGPLRPVTGARQLRQADLPVSPHRRRRLARFGALAPAQTSGRNRATDGPHLRAEAGHSGPGEESAIADQVPPMCRLVRFPSWQCIRRRMAIGPNPPSEAATRSAGRVREGGQPTSAD